MKIIGPWFVKELDELKVRGLHYDVTPVPSAAYRSIVSASRRAMQYWWVNQNQTYKAEVRGNYNPLQWALG